MTKYAIHNSGVGFVLKKHGDSGVDVKTHHSNSVVENIKTIYGPSVAKELLGFSLEDEHYKFKCHGHISNVNYNVKKMTFLLFINNRLVDCTALKRAIDHVYTSYLPKGKSPFVYMSLNIAPQNLDVNVHPTKHEVFFLHQDSIIEKIQQSLEDTLLNSNASRTFHNNKILPGAGVTLEMFESKEKTLAAKDMVRTDANMQKINKFFRSSAADRMEVDEASKKTETLKLDSLTSLTNLSSVLEVRGAIVDHCSSECRDLIANHTFVGCVDRELALLQRDTKLFLVNTTNLTTHLFKQIIFSQFGDLPVLRLCPPPMVWDLAMLAIENPESGWKAEDGEKGELVDQVVNRLEGHKEMLADYFSLEMEDIEGSLHLTGIPLLLENYCPWFGGLPTYLCMLATEVDWSDEIECFKSFAQVTASFYSVREVRGMEARFDMGQHGGAAEGDWRNIVEHVVFPAIKRRLLPPKDCLSDKTLVQVANLPDLYKVFERC